MILQRIAPDVGVMRDDRKVGESVHDVDEKQSGYVDQKRPFRSTTEQNVEE